MPLPLPSPKQKEKDFINSCMGNPTMNKEYPDQKQRAAICFSQWKRAKKKKQAKGSNEDPTWEEIEAEIKSSGTLECDGNLILVNLPTVSDKLSG